MTSQRNFYIDLGVNWANTARLHRDLFPQRTAWSVIGFEASPLIQPFANDYFAFLNGQRTEPSTCLPRSGSTRHLRLYAPSHGCDHTDNNRMRSCMWTCLSRYLGALKPDPVLNSTRLIQARLSEGGLAARPSRDHFTFVPAAASTATAFTRISGSPQQLIRGGALPGSDFKGYVFDVPSVDIAGWLETFRRDDFVFLKIDVEGAEHGIVQRIDALKVYDRIDAMAFECHGPCHKTLSIMKRWNVTMIPESLYHGMDSYSRIAPQTSHCPCASKRTPSPA